MRGAKVVPCMSGETARAAAALGVVAARVLSIRVDSTRPASINGVPWGPDGGQFRVKSGPRSAVDEV